MTQSPPTVVVACAWYNRADYIHDTVNSLLSQEYDSFEIIIVNDGSTDPRVRAILDSYVDPRLTIIHQDNTGFVGAIRRAIGASEAPLIAIQGAGDVSLPNRLAQQYKLLQTEMRYSAVACCRKEVFVGGPNDGVEFVSGRAAQTLHTSDFLGRPNPFSQGEVMFRRAAYDQVGGYRTYFKYAQDRDLWLRMSDVGPFFVLPEVLYIRRQFFDDGVSTNLEKKLMQGLLSDFARQSYRARSTHGYDLLDKYGKHAPLFRRRNRVVSRLIAHYALRKIYCKKYTDAKLAASLGLNEALTVTTFSVYALSLFLGKSSFLDQSFSKLLQLSKKVWRFRDE